MADSINDTQAVIDGLSYKIGVRGMVFIWANDKWIRSSKSKHQVLAAAESSQEKRNGNAKKIQAK